MSALDGVSLAGPVSRRGFLRSAALALGSGAGLVACAPRVPVPGPGRGAAPALPSLLVDSRGKPITSRRGWERRREQLRGAWLDYLGPLPANPRPPVLTVLEEDHPEGVIRQLVEYEGAPGITVRGYLLRPAAPGDRRAGVLALHSTAEETIRQPAGVEGAPEKAFGLDLARRGAVAFCPMCFLWDDKAGRSYEQQAHRFLQSHPGSTGMAKMLFDAQRGIDVLESQPDVDPARLGVIGHSLGAKEALYLAAFDSRVRVTVSSEGGVGIHSSNWDAPWYLGAAIHTFGHDHHEVLAMVAPRAFLLVGGESADGEHSEPFVDAACSVYRLYGVPDRLEFLNHRQGHTVPHIAQQRSYAWLERHLSPA